MADVAKTHPEKKRVGFCLTDEAVLHDEALRKLDQKQCDVIVANTANNIGSAKRTVHIYKKGDDTAEVMSDVPVMSLVHRLLGLV